MRWSPKACWPKPRAWPASAGASRWSISRRMTAKTCANATPTPGAIIITANSAESPLQVPIVLTVQPKPARLSTLDAITSGARTNGTATLDSVPVWNSGGGHLAQGARLVAVAVVSAVLTAATVISVGQSLIDRNARAIQPQGAALLIQTAG